MHRIKLYKYFLNNIEKPLIMEAESRKRADQMLMELNQRMGGNLRVTDIVDVRVETLIVGKSSKIKGGKKQIWVGTEHTKNGWMEQEEYLKIVINNKKQQSNG